MESNDKPRITRKKKVNKVNTDLAPERVRIQNRIKDSTPSQIKNDTNNADPVKDSTRPKVKKAKKQKKKIVKNTKDNELNSNSNSHQNNDFNDDPKEPPPLDMPLDVVGKIEQQVKQNEQATRKMTTKSKNSRSKQQLLDKNPTNPTKKIKKTKLKKSKRPLKKKNIEKSDGNIENNDIHNLNNSPKRPIRRITLKNKNNSSNKDPIIKSESSEEESSLSSSKKNIIKPKIQNHLAIRPSSSASSTKSLSQKHKDNLIKGKNYSDASNNSNTIKKSASSASSKKVQLPKDDYDERIDSTTEEEDNIIPKIRNNEISNSKKPRFDSNDQEPYHQNNNDYDDDSARYDRSNNYDNEEEEEEEEESDNDAPIPKEKNNYVESGHSGYNKPKFNKVSDSYSISDNDIRNELLSPIRRSLSDGTFKEINHDTLSMSGIIGSLGSQSSDDYYSNRGSTSNKKQKGKIKKINANFIIPANINNKFQNDDKIIRNRNERNRRNSDPTLDPIEFNDPTGNVKKKPYFDNFNNQNNNINFNRNLMRNQSVRIKKTNPQFSNNGNNMNFIRNNGNNFSNDFGSPTFPKFKPKQVNFHIQNYSNASFPINDDEFHDFEQTPKKKIDISPPIHFQMQIIPNPPIIAIDAELEMYNRSKLLKEIKKQQ